MILIQARTNSTRLPAKVLLPVGGLPAVVVAARRAANTGRPVVVATSSVAGDDLLAAILADHGITCFRGDLGNVLKRFVGAIAGLPDDEIIVRLTADNLFPDGDFVDHMVDVYLDSGVAYLTSGTAECGLPYGMSGEVMRAGHLREALATTTEAADLEHVTPYIRRTYGEQGFLDLADLGMADQRCTVDTLADYLKIAALFRRVDDPVAATHRELLELLGQATP
jgi:spore coat polysaccharide biosynthesis protein SpsF (cytidylyltransferase family)